MQSIYYVIVFGMLAVFGGTVIWSLWWAIRGGQFSDFQRGAVSIFDDDEPVGQVTDVFPDKAEEWFEGENGKKSAVSGVNSAENNK